MKRLEMFFREIGLATTLKELKIKDDRFEEMATRATQNGPLGNFMKLYKEDVLNILNLAK